MSVSTLLTASSRRRSRVRSPVVNRESRFARQRLGSMQMIDRDEVLHVARLARLELDESEVETISAELSKVLDHVASISELDLDGVEPTTHVVDVDAALRPDEA